MSERLTGTATRRQRAVAACLATVLLATAMVLARISGPAEPARAAAGDEIIATFYVPLFENNASAALAAVNNAWQGGGTTTSLSSTTSVTVAVPGTIVFYDHWEDGFEASANVPGQSTSLVLGDGVTSNGNAADYCVPARCAGDVMPAGAVLRLNNSTTVVPGPIAIPRSASVVVFDGRDKISATAGLAVTHATWPTSVDALHAQMAAAFDTSRWGVNFVAPVGTNTPQQGDGFDHFSYSGLEVMAKQAGTVVNVDANADGDFVDAGDVNGQTIGEGQTVFVNGGVAQGARVQTNVPVQVFLMTGRIGSNYADRSFQLFPTEGLVNDYIAPATAASAADAQATVLYLFNPQITAITVTVQTASGSTNYTIPAGQVLNPAPFLGVGETARVTSTATFAAIGATGTREGQQGQDFDWGYSLVPARLLSTTVNVGWAPGSQDLSNATYNPVWVTTTGATTLYVDYDGDPTTGPNLDPNGSRFDTSFSVTGALTLTKVTDPNDRDMTGARIYTTNGVTFASVYGEDPATAPLGFPGIDLGTALFPTCGAMCVQKALTLQTDVDGDGQIDPGDTILWTITAANTGYANLTNAVLVDDLQAGLDYVPGTASVAGSAIADDVVPPATTDFPFDGTGRSLGSIAVGGTTVVTYLTTVRNPYNGPSGRIVNTAIVRSDQATGGDTIEAPLDSLRLTKTSNAVEPVTVGQTIDYTLTVENAGASTLAPVNVADALPAGLTWVSTQVTRPADVVSTVADDLQTTNWSGSTGTNSWSQASWQEINDTTGASIWSTGQVRNVADMSSQRIRFIGPATNQGLSRIAGDMTGAEKGVTLSYSYRRSGMEADDAVAVQVRGSSTDSWSTLATYTNGTDSVYVNVSFDISALVGTATEVRAVVTNALDGTNDIFFLDNVSIARTDRVAGTVAGSAPTAVATLTELMPGESATVVVRATVSTLPNPEIVNTATATSGSFVSRATVSDCARCFDFGDAPASFEGSDPGRARIVSTPVFSTTSVVDDFAVSATWAGSTGAQAWSATTWTETDGGGLGTAAGRIRKVTDLGDLSVRWDASSAVNEGISRVVGDLSAVSSATLGFQRRCNSMEVDDVVSVEIRPTATAAWQTVATFQTCTDAGYVAQSYPLASGALGAATELRFRVTTAFETGDQFFLDDVRLDLTNANFPAIGPRLGAEVDREAAAASAAPGGSPVGDDLAGTPDDEDGVTLPSMDTDAYTFTFTVTDATGGPTYVNGWFDWDNDGVFETAESAFAAGTFVSGTNGLSNLVGVGVVPGPGTYSVTIDMPDLEANGSGYAIGGAIYSRFRVATSGSQITADKARGRSSDGEVEDYRTTLNTLPVNLSYIDPRRTGPSTVEVAWRTAQEVDNLGFHVYGERRDGSLVRLTRSLVPSRAPTTIEPQSYAVTVRTTSKVVWIEDVAVDGTRELNGPYRVGRPVGDPTPPAELDWDETQDALAALEAGRSRDAVSAARVRSREIQARFARTGRISRTDTLATFRVDTAGIQQVTYEDLVAVGVDLAGVPASALVVADPLGVVPIDVLGPSTVGPGTAIRFVGDPLDTIYSDVNVYRLWLDPTEGRRVLVDAPMTRVPSTPAVTTHRHTATTEIDAEYSVSAPGPDPWAERTLFAVSGRTRTATRTVTVDGLVPGTPTLVSVDLWGVTRNPERDEHHVRLTVNGTVLTEARFDDLEAFTLTADAPAGLIVEGPNTVSVSLIGDTGPYVTVVAVDAWHVTYDRANSVDSGSFDAQVTGRVVRVDGTAPVAAYRTNGRGHVSRVSSLPVDGGVVLTGRVRALRYLVADDAGIVRPVVAAHSAPAPLFGGRADYLVVAHPMLVDTLAPLVEYHRSLGRRVKVVEVDDIYDVYSGGVVDARAIDTYLARAIPRLGVRWLLMAGSDSIDYRDVDGDGSVGLVPSLYGATGFGISYAPIDPAYADVDGDGRPDVAMGRLPARTPEEMATLVDKTIAAATANRDRSVLLVSDAADAIDYAAAQDGVAEHFAGWTVRRADTDRLGVDAARAEMMDAFADGTTYALYVGHSSSHEWGQSGLFDASAAADVPTGAPTVVAQFGCWNTYYPSPYADSIAHGLLGDADGGAAAVLGATTLTSAGNDIALAESLADEFSSGTLTVGEALLAAKRVVERQIGGQTADVQLGWVLLGDPALPGVSGDVDADRGERG